MTNSQPDIEPGPGRYMAWLNADHTPSLAPCYVEDVSRSGAKLTVFSNPVPDQFTLHFNRRGDAKVRCRVMSRAGKTFAVEFVASLAIYA
jgi:hypothetical protein